MTKETVHCSAGREKWRKRHVTTHARDTLHYDTRDILAMFSSLRRLFPQQRIKKRVHEKASTNLKWSFGETAIWGKPPETYSI